MVALSGEDNIVPIEQHDWRVDQELGSGTLQLCDSEQSRLLWTPASSGVEWDINIFKGCCGTW